MSGSITASPRCSTSERISAVERIAIASTRQTGMTKSGGSSMIAADVRRRRRPCHQRDGDQRRRRTIPRCEKRALSVTTGIANQREHRHVRRRRRSATLIAIITCEPTQAAKIRVLGPLGLRSMRRSAKEKRSAATSQRQRGSTSRPRARMISSAARQHPESRPPDRLQAPVHVEHPCPVGVVGEQPALRATIHHALRIGARRRPVFSRVQSGWSAPAAAPAASTWRGRPRRRRRRPR